VTHYMLLLRREQIDFPSYSPEDMQQLLAEFDRWNTAMKAQGRLIASGNLPPGKGRTLRTGPVVADGPYSEVKEAVTGFFLISADSDDEAVQVASGCPFLPRGGSVELRPVPQLEFEAAARQVIDAQMAARAGAAGKGA